MPFLTDQDAKFIRERFAQELQHEVNLEFFTPSREGLALPGQDWETAEYTRQILAEVEALSPKLHLQVHSVLTEPEIATAYGIARTPATAVVGAQDYGIRYYGMPAGYEFATLIEVIILVSRGEAPLAEESRAALGRLQEHAHIQVFVTPT